MNYAPQIWEIEQLFNEKPDEHVPENVSANVPPYLSYNWWMNDDNN